MGNWGLLYLLVVVVAPFITSKGPTVYLMVCTKHLLSPHRGEDCLGSLMKKAVHVAEIGIKSLLTMARHFEFVVPSFIAICHFQR